jgi:serine/threonine protein phosphatase 1
MNHYVIGDVHGHYDTLIALVAKLPRDAQLIFVGDLIDRGEQSAEVVRFVRENNHLCVMGNHEDLMAGYGQFVLNAYKNDKPIGMCN